MNEDACLDDQALLTLVEGLGSDRTLARHRAHLARCEACRSLFADVEGCLTRSRDVPPSARTPSPDRAITRRYRFVRSLGEGGMGSVFAMRDHVLDRDVAVKTLHPWLASDEGAIVRFLQEAHLMARLDGRGAPRVIDVGTNEAGLPFIVMELVEGETLRARLDRKGRLPVAEAATLVARVCDALAVAHARGVIHRDVKPGNVMLERRRGELVVKLIDFGLAKADGAARQASMTGDVFGTPGYMSPEQLRDGHDADARSDIWAAGVLLYRCVTGTNPFSPALRADDVASFVPAGARVPHVSPEVDAVIARCLQPTARLRYASAAELAAALRELTSLETVRIERRTRPRGRRRAPRLAARLAPALAVALMAAAVFGALSFVLAR